MMTLSEARNTLFLASVPSGHLEQKQAEDDQELLLLK